MNYGIKTLDDVQVAGKTVLCRVDINEPVDKATDTLKDLTRLIAFAPQTLNNTLGEYLAKCGKKQFRIAETEKYAHVTFFFNGGVEQPPENGRSRTIPPVGNCTLPRRIYLFCLR